ncbi:MAG: hypothetical protein RL189_2234 [Pseudomonadota bacterium]|jgi:hypothetical protein
MAYRSRSKYTPGGGVLAFFEQVSRFVSLSVLGWVILSVFLILFVADGKITDSFDLRLVKSVFTDWRLFGTAASLLALNGIIGAIIALPAAFVLLMSRQYLDYHAGRTSRRGGAIKVKLVRTLPVAILILSHLSVLFLNLVSAPQITRNWFKKESHFASMTVGIHFVLTSLTRASFDKSSGATGKGSGSAKNDAAKSGRRLTVFMMPADFIESDDFKAEMVKLKGAQRIPFIMSRSNLIEQLDSLFASNDSRTFDLFRKVLAAPHDYGNLQKDGGSDVLLSLSPQVRFGRQPLGLASNSLAGLKETLFVYEAQRRLILSQFQIFSALRLLDGLPFFGRNMEWLDLVSDDVARIRRSARLSNESAEGSKSVSVIQLSAFESRFSSIQAPFKPLGWPEKISAYEKRLITKNIVRELTQFLHDSAANEKGLWAILPYADDRRVNPVSYALVKENADLNSNLNERQMHTFGMFENELGQLLGQFVDSELLPVTPENNAQNAKISQPGKVRLMCSVTEVDSAGSDFQFQSSEQREKSLGELLNSLSQLPLGDLAFLSKKSLNLIARDPGIGFLCRTDQQSIDETYLLKFQGYSKLTGVSELPPSILVAKGQASAGGLPRQQGGRLSAAPSERLSLPRTFDEISLQRDVLNEFLLFQLQPSDATSEPQRSFLWRSLDSREQELFFSKFEIETLKAIENFARARIH